MSVSSSLARFLAAVQEARNVHLEATRVARLNYRASVAVARAQLTEEVKFDDADTKAKTPPPERDET